ncbi:MAG TPA: UDP-glucose/GDP-mannose dehydrogenase family protein [bacterium]|nr:UDP-glucose/GDP-mannose dehydrogenase family protein [bacterium]
MKICVIGTGYVGLVDGACFAETGNEVTCVDVDQEKINLLLQGTIPIYEPGLAEIVERNVADNRLHFTTDLTQAVQNSEICFISVGTPPNEDGSADLSHVLAAAKDIAQAMNGYKVIVDKSTVPVGTADKVAEVIAQNSDQPFDVVSNPEFLKEGNAIDDFLQPDRIVVGANSDKAFKMMAELYSPFTTAGASLIKMDTRSAEMTKYAANAMLATRISFMNDLANLCEIVGADINLIRQGIGSDTRIGNTFLLAGAGYGGSCFPKDVKAIIKTAKENGYRLRLLESVEDVNHDQKQVVAKKTIQYFAGDLTGKTIAIWGLAFKAGTDDMREATSIDTIDLLLAAGATIKAHDPEALQTARRVFGDKITYSDKNYEILDGADALLVLTEWNEYREPDFDKIKNSLKQPVIFDGRNMYN